MSLDTGHDFRTARMLMKHYLQNHGTVPPLLENMKKYFCSNCPNVYTTKESFKSHVKHMHSNKPKKYERSKIRFQCPYCEKTYCGSKPLQDHIVLKHEKSPKYQCEICQGNLLGDIDNTVAIWTFTFHEKSGFVWVILKANWQDLWKAGQNILPFTGGPLLTLFFETLEKQPCKQKTV